MSFLTKTRLFSIPQRPTQLGGYFFDFLFLLFLWVSVSAWQNLHQLTAQQPIARLNSDSFVFFGALGLYGLRIASYVAMLRRNRLPQTPEWLILIISFGLAAPCFIASGHLVCLDATLHHYRFCYREAGRAPHYIFAAPTAACPPLPPHAIPY